MTINEQGETAFGTSPEIFTQRLDARLSPDGADVIGLNCSVGPQIIPRSDRKMRAHTTRRLSAQPNAGNPREESAAQNVSGVAGIRRQIPSA
ncbi:MAG: hypothetical protein U0X75_17675 [Acidobacteriota bacterium]